MNRRVRAGNWLGMLLGLPLLLIGFSGVVQAALEMRLFPNLVEMGAFYNGEEVELKGAIPPGTEAVVEVRGNAADQELLRKGRRGGLWMSVGEIQVQHAPSLYMVMSSAPKLPELAGTETSWGFQALARQVTFNGKIEPAERGKFFQEFLALKRQEGLYRETPGGVKVAAPHEWQCAIRASLPMPAKVPPGRYQVRLTVIQDGRLLEQKESDLTVKMVGFPALLADLAYGHGAVYGVIAVVIAIVTGFIMGVLFKGKAEH